jgi:hypothetical protein
MLNHLFQSFVNWNRQFMEGYFTWRYLFYFILFYFIQQLIRNVLNANYQVLYFFFAMGKFSFLSFIWR